MKACIYARTSRHEKLHTTTKVARQIAFCMDLARRFNVTVEPEHIFTDIELTGDLLPACWAPEVAPSRPALAALIAAVEEHSIARVIVHRAENLGTTSIVLEALREEFTANDVRIIASREAVEDPNDPTEQFALRILSPRLQFDTDDEQERRNRARAKKLEEIERLRAKLARLESELGQS